MEKFDKEVNNLSNIIEKCGNDIKKIKENKDYLLIFKDLQYNMPTEILYFVNGLQFNASSPKERQNGWYSNDRVNFTKFIEEFEKKDYSFQVIFKKYIKMLIKLKPTRSYNGFIEFFEIEKKNIENFKEAINEATEYYDYYFERTEGKLDNYDIKDWFSTEDYNKISKSLDKIPTEIKYFEDRIRAYGTSPEEKEDGWSTMEINNLEKLTKELEEKDISVKNVLSLFINLKMKIDPEANHYGYKELYEKKVLPDVLRSKIEEFGEVVDVFTKKVEELKTKDKDYWLGELRRWPLFEKYKKIYENPPREIKFIEKKIEKTDIFADQLEDNSFPFDDYECRYASPKIRIETTCNFDNLLEEFNKREKYFQDIFKTYIMLKENLKEEEYKLKNFSKEFEKLSS